MATHEFGAQSLRQLADGRCHRSDDTTREQGEEAGDLVRGEWCAVCIRQMERGGLFLTFSPLLGGRRRSG